MKSNNANALAGIGERDIENTWSDSKDALPMASLSDVLARKRAAADQPKRAPTTETKAEAPCIVCGGMEPKPKRGQGVARTCTPCLVKKTTDGIRAGKDRDKRHKLFDAVLKSLRSMPLSAIAHEPQEVQSAVLLLLSCQWEGQRK